MTDLLCHAECLRRRVEGLVEAPDRYVRLGPPAAEAHVDGEHQTLVLFRPLGATEQRHSPAELADRLVEAPEVPARDRGDELRIAPRPEVGRVGVIECLTGLFDPRGERSDDRLRDDNGLGLPDLYLREARPIVKPPREALGLLTEFTQILELPRGDPRAPELEADVELERKIRGVAEAIEGVQCRLEEPRTGEVARLGTRLLASLV